MITRHFGFDGEAAPISEIAAEIHVSPQRARAIERDALHELADELALRLYEQPQPGAHDGVVVDDQKSTAALRQIRSSGPRRRRWQDAQADPHSS